MCLESCDLHADEADIVRKFAPLRKVLDLGGHVLNEFHHWQAHAFPDRFSQAYFAERFHSLSMDIEGDIEIVDFAGTDMTQKEFARQNRVRATPLLVFFDLEGKPLLKYVGAPSGKQEFIWMGEFVAEKVYLQKDDAGRNIRFARYKRMKKDNAL